MSCSNEEQKENVVSSSGPGVQKENGKISEAGGMKATGLFHDTIYAHSSGKVEWITEKQNKISKRTHLFTINNTKVYLKLYNDKATFKFLLDSLIDYCPEEIQIVKPKWEKFDDQLRFDTLTPRFPKIDYKEEADYFATAKMINAYNKMLLQEKQMKNNFEFAQRDYTHVEWKIKKGQQVKKGQVIGVTTN